MVGWEAAGRSTTMFRVLRVQVEARLLPPHAPRRGGEGSPVTRHPRSCLKNASSPACQRWFPSDPHAGTSERIPVGSTSADLRRDVCGAGKFPMAATPAVPRDMDTPQPGSGSLGIEIDFFLLLRDTFVVSDIQGSDLTPQPHRGSLTVWGASRHNLL